MFNLYLKKTILFSPKSLQNTTTKINSYKFVNIHNMRKIIWLTAIAMFLVLNVDAQTKVPAKKKAEETAKEVASAAKKAVSNKDDGWKKGGEGLLNTSYTAFSQWAEGGINTLNLVGNVNLFADRRVGQWLWENDGRFTLGFSRTRTDGFVKGADLIDIDSKLGRQFNEKMYWSNLLTFDSQFLLGETFGEEKVALAIGDPGYPLNDDGIPDPSVTGAEVVVKRLLGESKFLSPAMITFGSGIDYKPQDWISVYFSPITFKGIIVNDQTIADSGIHGNRVDTLANGVLEGRRFKPELGARLLVGAKRDLTESLSVASSIDLYSNFLQNKFGDVKPQNIDVLWITNVGLKVTKYIAANFEYTLKYDDEIGVPKTRTVGGEEQAYTGKGIQGKSFLGVGFTYKF